MNHEAHDARIEGASSNPGAQSRRSAVWTGIVMLLLIAAFYVLREHWSHVLGAWPYLLLLLCPLMHTFMHRGHGGRSHRPN